jgi:hypothetical protein
MVTTHQSTPASAVLADGQAALNSIAPPFMQ